ncbi:hypothetical protein EVAR_95286_1 [Eumeta japonica]|uniref:Uncharacterized protein n=1 Tax=Eumeta variegata TaxID=151549 RepID=A0A4C1UAG8_EUMVA|nr:hypothetical protein EVAR_95286_1 [Eumeta japonica]
MKWETEMRIENETEVEIECRTGVRIESVAGIEIGYRQRDQNSKRKRDGIERKIPKKVGPAERREYAGGDPAGVRAPPAARALHRYSPGKYQN